MATEVGALPNDAIANVFRGLLLRSLAVVRCVCKAWRDVVDARALLLPHLHLLPHTVRGVFMNYLEHPHPHHFVCPCSSSTIPRVDGTLSFLPNDSGRRWVSVLYHYNGLLLCGGSKTELNDLCVCNTATRRWTVLPCWWGADDNKHDRYAGPYIAFDPAKSLQYEVILVPAVPKAPPPPEVHHCTDYRWSAAEVQRRALLWEKEKDVPFCLGWFFSLPDDGMTVGQWEFQQHHDINDPCCYMEWPPTPWTLRVFSSNTGQWEDRAFVREGLPAGSVEKMRSDLELPDRPRWRYAVYHHGSLYVHCCGSFVTRLSLSKSNYQIVKTPANVNEYTKPYLGKLLNGVCLGIVQDHKLKIWILDKSCGQMEWLLKYVIVVRPYVVCLASIEDYNGGQHDGSWTIEENIEIGDIDHDVESLSEEEGNEIEDIDHDVESLSEEENIEIQDTDHDVESLSEEENIEIHDTDHDVESLSAEENIEIQDTDHDVDSLSEEENTEIQDTDHDVESLSKEGHEWDSDNDDTFTIHTKSQEYFNDDQHLHIIGFHPYKEVVFIV